MIVLFILAALLMLEVGFFVGLLIRKELRSQRQEAEYEAHIEASTFPLPTALAGMKRTDLRREHG